MGDKLVILHQLSPTEGPMKVPSQITCWWTSSGQPQVFIGPHTCAG